jgi:hypothetical protein
MIKLQEVKASEARVRKLVKNIKPVDTSKVQLPEKKVKPKSK